jgi:uncharacterized protein YecA (UPF0149 family)
MARTRNSYPFDRPVIILAAPRSGSTLLFETLACSSDFWTIGGESHGIFESIPQFNPQTGMCTSNALSSVDLSDDISSRIHLAFLSQLRDSRGRPYSNNSFEGGSAPRILEKTPKNAVRVSMLNELFPDALYIYLYRNPRENISSIIDAWRSGRFVTYRNLPGRSKPWSLLLPPGWESYGEAPVEEVAAFQWCSANMAILRELSKMKKNRWAAVSYGQAIHDTDETIKRLCKFCDVSPDRVLASLSDGGLKFSRYTLTAPTPSKWHKNADAIGRVISRVTDTVRYVREMTSALPPEEFDTSVDPSLMAVAPRAEVAGQAEPVPGWVARNALCPCGSGEKYKRCHGRLQQNGTMQ